MYKNPVSKNQVTKNQVNKNLLLKLVLERMKCINSLFLQKNINKVLSDTEPQVQNKSDLVYRKPPNFESIISTPTTRNIPRALYLTRIDPI